MRSSLSRGLPSWNENRHSSLARLTLTHFSPYVPCWTPQALAQKCNPTIGFYDPLGLVAKATDDNTEEATLGWLRHAEIKHGRVAMAAFVGFIVQSNGICFPWALTGGDNAIMHSDILAAGGPGDQWDALPTAAKLQILGFVGILELISETTVFLNQAGEKHYVKGGKPGFFPPFSAIGLPHPVRAHARGAHALVGATLATALPGSEEHRQEPCRRHVRR